MMDLGAWIIMTDMTMMIDRFWGVVVSQIEANPFSNYIKVKKLIVPKIRNSVETVLF